MLQGYLFSLLVQAAGTVLLFVVFLLLYRKFRRPAFLDWIASWISAGGPGQRRRSAQRRTNAAPLTAPPGAHSTILDGADATRR
jgi:hypothetical protein